jgi:8-oxo-dGTP diphosphatase
MCIYNNFCCGTLAISGYYFMEKKMSKIDEHLKTGSAFVPAVVCYFKKGDKVLLGIRKRVSLGLGKNLIAGIGGKVGDKPEYQDETLEEALAREVMEEISVRIVGFRRVGRVRFIWPDKPKWQQEVIVFIVDNWEGEPQETEAMKPMWFSITSLPVSRMWDDNAYWVPKVLAGEHVNATFLYGKEGKVIDSVFE